MFKTVDKVYSGAIHYFRVPKEYWYDRLLKLKAMGLNTVETYVAWNAHEKEEGVFDFSGDNDIRKFIETARDLGLYCIVRPGPYICAEWDFGGFPAYLLKDRNIVLRALESTYMAYVKRYLTRLFEEIKDLQISRGGNIIAMQVENEYGSYGRDKEYLEELKKIYVDCGIDCTLFTSDGETRNHLSGGGLKDELMVANFGSNPQKKFKDLKELQPNKPLMCGEFWCGWFTNYGGNYNAGSSASEVAKYLKDFIDMDANFNFYMFHGGTNFGFTAGANCYARFTPDVASYDYGAPLTEWGDYTEKYHKCRKVLLEKQGIEGISLPPSPKTFAYDSVKLNASISLKEALAKGQIGKTYQSHILYPMEHYSQNQGYIVYSTEIEGNYSDTVLTLNGVHDVAYVYINGEKKGVFNRLDVDYYKGGTDTYEVKISAFSGKIKVDILVEALGRVNYGDKIYDRKGIESVKIAGQLVYNWTVRCLSFEDIENLTFGRYENVDEPKFLKGNFKVEEKSDTFIDLNGFTKGVVFINGKNLGRYWNIGPQRTFYIPAPYLKEDNEVVIFELEKAYSDVVSFSEKPIYGNYLPKNSNPKKAFLRFLKK